MTPSEMQEATEPCCLTTTTTTGRSSSRPAAATGARARKGESGGRTEMRRRSPEPADTPCSAGHCCCCWCRPAADRHSHHSCWRDAQLTPSRGHAAGSAERCDSDDRHAAASLVSCDAAVRCCHECVTMDGEVNASPPSMLAVDVAGSVSDEEDDIVAAAGCRASLLLLTAGVQLRTVAAAEPVTAVRPERRERPSAAFSLRSVIRAELSAEPALSHTRLTRGSRCCCCGFQLRVG